MNKAGQYTAIAVQAMKSQTAGETRERLLKQSERSGIVVANRKPKPTIANSSAALSM
jgi:hypothetical protein